MGRSWTDFIAGTGGGFIGKLFDYPFDTVKVLLQTQDVVGYKGPKYTGAIHCLKHTVETGGVMSLYKGISSPLLGSMAENAVLFLSYGIFKDLLGGQDAAARGEDVSLFRLSLAGAGAGAVVPCVLTPVELVKCRLQVQNSINTGFLQYTVRVHPSYTECCQHCASRVAAHSFASVNPSGVLVAEPYRLPDQDGPPRRDRQRFIQRQQCNAATRNSGQLRMVRRLRGHVQGAHPTWWHKERSWDGSASVWRRAEWGDVRAHQLLSLSVPTEPACAM
jgi:hypothetical protein